MINGGKSKKYGVYFVPVPPCPGKGGHGGAVD